VPRTLTKPFRELCAEHVIAATHQRQILYEVMHPRLEETYARMKKEVPAISRATL